MAHTANDAVDVIDLARAQARRLDRGAAAVAGALVTETPDFVFTSNRGEDTVGIFAAGVGGPGWKRSGSGCVPNGLAYDPGRRRLLAAHIGDRRCRARCTVSVVDVGARRRIADVAVAGRTRWASTPAPTPST